MEKYLIDNNDGQPRHFCIENIGQFLELCTWLYGNEQVIFRGQRRQQALLPNVARNSEYVRTEEEVFNEFKREASPYLDYIPESSWQWLAVARHNGLPTRLLDWTKNSLAALWFTVQQPACKKESGVVWAFGYDCEHLVSDEQFEKSPFEISKILIYFPDHIYPFIQAQSGLFTVHPKKDGDFKPMEEIANSDLLLTKIEIPADFFPTIRHQLFWGGVHHASLFPGLSGLVKKIRYQHELLDDEGGA